MRKRNKAGSKRAKFKKLERRFDKGKWHHVLIFGVLWFGVMGALTISLLDYLKEPGPTVEKMLITLSTQCFFGIPVGLFTWSLLKKDYLNQKTSWKMGAWGMGVFDDDTSCDYIEVAMQQDHSIEVLINKALSVRGLEYLECTECHEIIVASAMSNALINNVSYSEIDDLYQWLEKQDPESVRPFKSELIAALQRVLGKESELNELWAENKESYPIWRSNIEGLIKGLS